MNPLFRAYLLDHALDGATLELYTTYGPYPDGVGGYAARVLGPDEVSRTPDGCEAKVEYTWEFTGGGPEVCGYRLRHKSGLVIGEEDFDQKRAVPVAGTKVTGKCIFRL